MDNNSELLAQYKKNPEDPDLNYRLGHQLLKKGKLPEAAKLLKKAIQLNRKNVDAYLDFAEIFIKKNNKEKADNLYKVVLKIDPDNEVAKTNLGISKKKEPLREIEVPQHEEPVEEISIGINKTTVNQVEEDVTYESESQPAQVEKAIDQHSVEAPPTPQSDVWYFSSNNDKRGPVDFQTIVNNIRSGIIERRDLVWKEGWPDWVEVDRTDEFKGEFVSNKLEPQPAISSPHTPRFESHNLPVEKHKDQVQIRQCHKCRGTMTLKWICCYHERKYIHAFWRRYVVSILLLNVIALPFIPLLIYECVGKTRQWVCNDCRAVSLRIWPF